MAKKEIDPAPTDDELIAQEGPTLEEIVRQIDPEDLQNEQIKPRPIPLEAIGLLVIEDASGNQYRLDHHSVRGLYILRPTPRI